MIDLSEYYTTESRTREAVAYLDLASAILAAEAEEMNDPELALP